MIRRNSRVGPHHALAVIGTTAIAVVVAYIVFGWLVGVVAFLIKTVVVVGIVAAAVWVVVRLTSRGRP